MKDISNKLTVLLIIKDRAEYTLRWMKYADSISFPFYVIIADGGRDKNLEKVLLDGKKFSNLNYKYVRFPYDETYEHYYSKQYNASKLVRTKYCVMADDDDFFIIKGLYSSILYLENNTDIVACGGATCLFKSIDYNNDLYSKKGYIYSKNSHVKLINDSSPINRLKKYFDSYFVTYYYVHRTEALQKSLSIVHNTRPFSLRLFEIMLAASIVMQGKIGFIKGHYLLRQIQSSINISSHVNDIKKNGDTSKLMDHALWSDNYIRGIILKTYGNDNKNLIFKNLKEIIKSYLSRARKINKNKIIVINFLKFLLPIFTYKTIIVKLKASGWKNSAPKNEEIIAIDRFLKEID